jgi:hypothetical protein
MEQLTFSTTPQHHECSAGILCAAAGRHQDTPLQELLPCDRTPAGDSIQLLLEALE